VSRYAADFRDDGAHGHCRDLLERARLESGLVLDLGCGSGPLAEQVTALGLEYVGTDVDQTALGELADRGFEAHALDLQVEDHALDAALAAVVGDRTIVAVLLLDVIEHLVDPGTTLRAIARLGTDEIRPLVVVSIPNVSHVDIGAKLLAGRWDTTKVGLLDDTHLRFFNAARIEETMAAAGWREVDAHDVVNPFSDQQFPADAPVLRHGVPLRHFLTRIRGSADAYGDTYQFVRSFEPGPSPTELPDGRSALEGVPSAPFLSVVVQVSGSGDGLSAVLRDLAEQTLADFEVLVTYDDLAEGADLAGVPGAIDHDVRVLKSGPDGRNRAIAEAAGRYLSFVDDRTRLAPEFVATIHRLADEAPGQVVQLGAHLIDNATPADAQRTYGELVVGRSRAELDPLDLVNIQPYGSIVLAAHAVPRQACATTGVRFAPEPRIGSATLFLLRCVELCGIARTHEPVTAIETRVVRPLADDLEFLKVKLGADPLLLPAGAASQLLHLRATLAAVVPERDELAGRLAAANDRLGALSALLVQRQDQLTRLTAEVGGLRAAKNRRIGTRVRRRLGRLARRV
jgi:SAM-dependent methyltransferase